MNEMKKSYRNADATPQIRSHWNEGETAIGNWCVDKCDRVKECELYDGNSTQSGARERERENRVHILRDCMAISEKSH